MKKLPAVEEARAIMKEGMEWGVWKWLMEKKRVRQIADDARTALDELEIQVKLIAAPETPIRCRRSPAVSGTPEASATMMYSNARKSLAATSCRPAKWRPI